MNFDYDKACEYKGYYVMRGMVKALLPLMYKIKFTFTK